MREGDAAQRRNLMTMTGAALLLVGGRALAQSASDHGSTEAKVVRIYATADGGSRVEELTISPDAKPIDITRMNSAPSAQPNDPALTHQSRVTVTVTLAARWSTCAFAVTGAAAYGLG
jgi:hypothetical protein